MCKEGPRLSCSLIQVMPVKVGCIYMYFFSLAESIRSFPLTFSIVRSLYFHVSLPLCTEEMCKCRFSRGTESLHILQNPDHHSRAKHLFPRGLPLNKISWTWRRCFSLLSGNLGPFWFLQWCGVRCGC